MIQIEHQAGGSVEEKRERLPEEKISINGAEFLELRNAVDSVLNVMLTNMWENCQREGETVIRIKAEIFQDWVPDLCAKERGAMRKIDVPVFKYAVNSVLKRDCKTNGTINGGNYELVFHEGQKQFYRRLVDDGQERLF